MQSVVQFVVEGASYDEHHIIDVLTTLSESLNGYDIICTSAKHECIVRFSIGDGLVYNESELEKKWIEVGKIIAIYYPGYNVVRTNICHKTYEK